MDNNKRKLVILGGGGMKTPYAVDLNMSIDSDYILSAHLIDQNGDQIGEEQTIDLPLESMVVSGSYDSQTQSLILTLDNGNTITIPVDDLVSGLQEEITSQNPLSCDLLTDGQTNKVFTATEQTKLSGIASGAEVNVQADWTQSDSSSDSFILNKPTIPTVNDSTITIQQNGTTVGSFTTNDSNDTTINLTGGGGNQWFGSQSQFDSLSTYDDNTDYFISDKIDYRYDILHTPDLSVYSTKSEVKTKNDQQDSEIVNSFGKFMTQQEYDNLQNKQEGVNYWIEGNAVEMVVTFTDQSTATYYVMVD